MTAEKLMLAVFVLFMLPAVLACCAAWVASR